MSDFAAILFLSLIGSVFGLIGGLLFLYIPAWSHWLSKYSTPFAAGVLLTISLLGLLPEATHEIGENAYILMLAAFLASYLFEHFFFGLHHHETHEHSIHKGSISLVIVGDTIHNFVDGVAIAAAYFVAPGFGIISAITTFLHEIPHEIGDFGILHRAKWKKQKIILVNILSSLASIVGALSIFYITKDEVFIGSLLAISAGIFLYLGASDFLPHLTEDTRDRVSPVFVLLAGVVLVYLLLNLIPHTEIENDHSMFRLLKLM